MEHHDLLAGFIRLHVLHHAAEHEIYGLWMIEELARHGYRLSPGTLYPILARMARRGWLRAAEPTRSKAARVYRLTPRGHEILTQLLASLDELYGEVGRHRQSALAPREATPRPQKPHPPRTKRTA